MLNWYNLPSDWLNQSSFWCYWKWPSIYQKYQNIKWNDNTLVIFASQRFSVHSAPHKQGLLLPLSGSCITDTYKWSQMGQVMLTRATGCHQGLLEVYPWWYKHFLKFFWWFQGPCSLIHNSSIRNILCSWNVPWFYAFSIRWINNFIGKQHCNNN